MNRPNPLSKWRERRAMAGDRDWRRPGPDRAQQRVDRLLALFFLAVGVCSAFLISSLAAAFGSPPPTWPSQAMWVVLLSAPLAWRRRFPASVTLVISAVFMTSQLLEFPDNTFASAALFWSIYSLGAWGKNRKVAFWVRVGVILAMFGLLSYSLYRYSHSPELNDLSTPAGLLDPFLANALYGLSFNLAFFLAAAFFGNAAWTSARREFELAEQARALSEQTQELRLVQEQNARRAVVSERVRIARELHDVVAHHVSVMGVQASAARRVLRKDPELASESLAAVEQTARSAISELRSLLGVLRDQRHSDGAAADGSSTEDSDFLSAPGIEQIPQLLAQAEGAGLRVAYGTFGTPIPLAAGLSLSAFRIIQEALTNTIKHAGAQQVDIRIRFLERTLEVEVTDDGRGLSVRPAECGFGQVGIRERVAVHGGEVEMGSRPGSGYRVRARFPLPVAMAAPQSVPAQPAPTRPAPTQPAPTRSASAQSAPVQPAPTQPGPTQPGPTQPEPSQREPTEQDCPELLPPAGPDVSAGPDMTVGQVEEVPVGQSTGDRAN